MKESNEIGGESNVDSKVLDELSQPTSSMSYKSSNNIMASDRSGNISDQDLNEKEGRLPYQNKSPTIDLIKKQ